MEFQEPELVVGRNFLKQVLPRIAAAQKSIDVLCYFWGFADSPRTGYVGELLNALRHASERGVQVRVLAPRDGVVAILKREGLEARRVHTKKLMHAKVMIFDGVVALVGSHNYTAAALSENVEVSVFVRFASSDHDLNVLFRNLWG